MPALVAHYLYRVEQQSIIWLCYHRRPSPQTWQAQKRKKKKKNRSDEKIARKSTTFDFSFV
jgi:hypothetical protein